MRSLRSKGLIPPDSNFRETFTCLWPRLIMNMTHITIANKHRNPIHSYSFPFQMKRNEWFNSQYFMQRFSTNDQIDNDKNSTKSSQGYYYSRGDLLHNPWVTSCIENIQGNSIERWKRTLPNFLLALHESWGRKMKCIQTDRSLKAMQKQHWKQRLTTTLLANHIALSVPGGNDLRVIWRHSSSE